MDQQDKTFGRTERGQIRIGLAYAAAFVGALVVMIASPAAAQDCGTAPGEDTYTICGYVLNDAGEALSGVVVKATATGNDDGSGITNESGFYAISVGLGTWTVAVDATTTPTGSGAPSQSVEVMGNDDVHTGVNFEISSGEGDVENTVPNPCDFVTSGGFVLKDAKKVSFGAHGGCKNGDFWGHINMVDHANGYHVNSVEITGYVAPFGVENVTRDVCGLATTNSKEPQPMLFRVRLIDNGEPGREDDFGILLADATSAKEGYYTRGFQPLKLADVKPGGGNVQGHHQNPSTTGPALAECGGLSFVSSTLKPPTP